MKVSIWIAIGLLCAAGCEEPKETRYKRAMREIERAEKALKDGLKPEKITDVPATQARLKGQADSIVQVISRQEVASHIDEDDFRNYLDALREDATALEKAIGAGRLEEAMNVLLPRVDSACTLCHTQYREGGE